MDTSAERIQRWLAEQAAEHPEDHSTPQFAEGNAIGERLGPWLARYFDLIDEIDAAYGPTGVAQFGVMHGIFTTIDRPPAWVIAFATEQARLVRLIGGEEDSFADLMENETMELLTQTPLDTEDTKGGSEE